MKVFRGGGRDKEEDGSVDRFFFKSKQKAEATDLHLGLPPSMASHCGGRS